MSSWLLRFAVLGVAVLASAGRAAERPNVLVLFADDRRADTIAALGNPVIRTPNLDHLVRRSVAFDRAYMQGGLQGATCVPSRAMLLSGRGLFRIDEKLIREPTWPAAFGRAGYATFATGKWHNGPASVPKSFQGEVVKRDVITIYADTLSDSLFCCQLDRRSMFPERPQRIFAF